MQVCLYAMVLLSSGCALAPIAPTEPDELKLPEHPEPRFEAPRFKGLAMRTIFSTADLVSQLKVQFPMLQDERASLKLFDDELIGYQRQEYRRVTFLYDDMGWQGPHGTCGQSVILWFRNDGSLYDIFVSPYTCPI